MPESTAPPLTIAPPIYLVLSEHGCWRCHKITPVITLATERIFEDTVDDLAGDDEEQWEDEIYILSNIATLPDDLLWPLQQYSPGYRHTYSRTAGVSYFMNHCARCDAALGDFFMHDEPGSAFFPETEDEMRRLCLVELPLKSPLRLSCSYGIRSDSDLLLKHATRKPYRS